MSPVWYSGAMISSLLGLLLKKNDSLSVSPAAGARPFAQVFAAIVLLAIATVAASTVARRPPITSRATSAMHFFQQKHGSLAWFESSLDVSLQASPGLEASRYCGRENFHS